MTKPGGSRSLTAGLDIGVQMQGIAAAMSELAGLTTKTSKLNDSILDFGRTSQSASSMALGGYREQADLLSKMHVVRTLLNKEDLDEFNRLKSKMALPGGLPKDDDIKLKNLEKQALKQHEFNLRMGESTKEVAVLGEIMRGVGDVGEIAFGSIGAAFNNIDNAQASTASGFNILKDSWKTATGIVGDMFDAMTGGAEENELGAGIEQAAQDVEISELRVGALVGLEEAAASIKISELKVKILRFDKAVGREEGAPGKGSEIGKKVSKAVEKSDTVKSAAKDKIKDVAVDKLGGKAAKAGEAIKGVSKASKTAGPFLTKLAGRFGKFGKVLSRVGPHVARVVGAVVAGGPVMWAAAGILVAAAALMVAGIMAVVAAFKFLKEGFDVAIKDIELLREVNYRALGSMHDLASASYDIGAATGLSTEETMKAIKAMSDAGVTAAELASRFGDSGNAMRDLATMQGEFTRMTGVSADTVAVLQKRLMVSGVGMKGMQKTLDRTSMTMRKFGISGKDATALMGTLSGELKNLGSIYSESDINDYVDSMTGLAAAAKRAGVNMGVVKKISGELRSLKGASTTLMVLGGHLDELMEKGAAAGNLGNLVSGYERALSMTRGMKKGIQDAALASMGITDDMRAMLDTEKQRRDAIKKNFQEQGMGVGAAYLAMKKQIKLEDDAKKLREDAMNDYGNSISTLNQQFQQFLAPIQAKAAKAMLPFVEFLTEIVAIIGPGIGRIVGGIIEVLGALGKEIISFVKPFLPVLDVVFTYASMIIGRTLKSVMIGIKILGLAFRVVRWPLFLLLGVFKQLWKVVKPIVNAIYDGWCLVADAFAGAIDYVSDFFDAFMSLDWLGDAFASVFGGIWSVVKTVFGAIYDYYAFVFGGLIDILMAVGGFVLDVFLIPFKIAWGVISTIFGFIYDVIAGVLSPIIAVGTAIYDFIAGPAEESGGIFSSVFGFIGDVISTLFAPIKAIGQFIYDFVTNPFEVLCDVVSSVFGTIGSVISGVLGFLLSPIDAITSAFGSVWGAAKRLFNGLLDLIPGPLKLLGAVVGGMASAAGAVWDFFTGDDDEEEKTTKKIDDMGSNLTAAQKAAVKDAEEQLAVVSGSAIGGVWDWLTGGGEEEKATKKIDDMGSNLTKAQMHVKNKVDQAKTKMAHMKTGAAYGHDGDWLSGPYAGGAKAIKKISNAGNDMAKAQKAAMKVFESTVFKSPIASAVSGAWDWLTSGNEKDKVISSLDDMGGEMAEAYSSMKSPLSSAIDGIQGAISSAWDWLVGDDKKSTIADVKSQMAEAAIAGPPKAAAAPMYTSKFDDDTKRTQGERTGDLVKLQRETVALLSKILEKTDPDNEKSAEALQRIAELASQTDNTPKMFRSREGFGEHVVHWWNNK